MVSFGAKEDLNGLNLYCVCPHQDLFIFFFAAFGAMLQGSSFGLVGLLPRKYSAVFMSGQGLAGTFAALAMIFAIASKKTHICTTDY